MSSSCRISIITVVYNGVGTLERTIQSVLNQSYKNMEYIIIDGASTDGTQQIIERYRDQLTFYISEPDDGIYDAMNKGISYATGDLIGFINSDDWYAEGAIESIADAYERTHADVIYGETMLVDASGGQRLLRRFSPEHFFEAMPFGHPGTFAAVKKNGNTRYFNKEYRIAADYDMLLGFYLDNAEFYPIDDVVAFFSLSGVSTRYEYLGGVERCVSAFSRIKDDQEKLRLFGKRVAKQYFMNEFKNDCIFGQLDSVIKEYMSHYTKKIVYGSGADALFMLELFARLGVNIDYLVDGNPHKQGTQIQGLEIYNPDVLMAEQKCIVVIATSVYGEEIKNHLTQINLPPSVEVKEITFIAYEMEMRYRCGYKYVNAMIREIENEEF